MKYEVKDSTKENKNSSLMIGMQWRIIRVRIIGA